MARLISWCIFIVGLLSVQLLASHLEEGDRVDDHPEKHGVSRSKRSFLKHHIFKKLHLIRWLKKTHTVDVIPRIATDFKYSKLYPGTKWCGDGNRARHFSDLGRKWREDSCCRAHDRCSHAVEAGKVKYGIRNYAPFTWSHCGCDAQFYDCLKRTRTMDSDIIGFTYFDVVDNYCIYQDYPQSCSKLWFLKVKCFRDTSRPKIWQKRKIHLSYSGVL